MEIKSFKNKKYFKLAEHASNFVGSLYVILGGLTIVIMTIVMFISIGYPQAAKEFSLTPKLFLELISFFAMGLVIQSASKLFKKLVNLIEEVEKTV